MITKEHILDEIRRTAVGGKALGRKQFLKATGIREADWLGRYWARWGDAQREAGFAANTLNQALDEQAILESLINLMRELGRFPGSPDMRLRRRGDPSFPNDKVFFARYGSKAALVDRVVEYCRDQPDAAELLTHCRAASGERPTRRTTNGVREAFGFVYLFKSSGHFKIGRSNAVGRREYEVALQLPEKLTVVHTIKTDDPVGIEDYWHRRFAAKRLNGEWFALDPADVRAFKRREFM